MSIRISLGGSLALGIAVAFAPLAEAATLFVPGPQPTTESLTQSVRLHHHGHKMHHMHHGMMSKGPGRCGENMYFSRKKGFCLDARDKS
jgi:hypothetical protein